MGGAAQKLHFSDEMGTSLTMTELPFNCLQRVFRYAFGEFATVVNAKHLVSVCTSVSRGWRSLVQELSIWKGLILHDEVDGFQHGYHEGVLLGQRQNELTLSIVKLGGKGLVAISLAFHLAKAESFELIAKECKNLKMVDFYATSDWHLEMDELTYGKADDGTVEMCNFVAEDAIVNFFETVSPLTHVCISTSLNMEVPLHIAETLASAKVLRSIGKNHQLKAFGFTFTPASIMEVEVFFQNQHSMRDNGVPNQVYLEHLLLKLHDEEDFPSFADMEDMELPSSFMEQLCISAAKYPACFKNLVTLSLEESLHLTDASLLKLAQALPPMHQLRYLLLDVSGMCPGDEEAPPPLSGRGVDAALACLAATGSLRPLRRLGLGGHFFDPVEDAPPLAAALGRCPDLLDVGLLGDPGLVAALARACPSLRRADLGAGEWDAEEVEGYARCARAFPRVALVSSSDARGGGGGAAAGEVVPPAALAARFPEEAWVGPYRAAVAAFQALDRRRATVEDWAFWVARDDLGEGLRLPPPPVAAVPPSL